MAKHCKYRVRQIENAAENGFLEVPTCFFTYFAKIAAYINTADQKVDVQLNRMSKQAVCAK